MGLGWKLRLATPMLATKTLSLSVHVVDDMQLLNVSTEEVKSMMETVAKDTLTSYQVHCYSAIQSCGPLCTSVLQEFERPTTSRINSLVPRLLV